jgi:hypothetical protein
LAEDIEKIEAEERSAEAWAFGIFIFGFLPQFSAKLAV